MGVPSRTSIVHACGSAARRNLECDLPDDTNDVRLPERTLLPTAKRAFECDFAFSFLLKSPKVHYLRTLAARG
jgi:hypothetical protein